MTDTTPSPTDEHRLTRRSLLSAAAAVGGLVALPRVPGAWAAPDPRGGRLPDGLFALGVASGDPLSESVVLWTRLAPHPLGGGGMPDRTVPVQWQVAADEGFRRSSSGAPSPLDPSTATLCTSRSAASRPSRGTGSASAPAVSCRRPGAPAPRRRPTRRRSGWPSPSPPARPGPRATTPPTATWPAKTSTWCCTWATTSTKARPGPAGCASTRATASPTLVEYRNRHAQYKTDPDLQAAHAAFPWLVTWDDHEVDNNWADGIPQDPQLQSHEAFLARRAAAFQAYCEHMPLRRRPRAHGSRLRLYRRALFGDLAAFNVLDGRQHRSDQPCSDPFIGPDCAERYDPSLTMLGDSQERWLTAGLAGSQARWNVLANQTIFAQYDYDPSVQRAFNTDQWDGYPVARQRLLDLFASGRVANPVVITGDWHSSWVNELKVDFDGPASRTVGTELVGTSIASACPWAPRVAQALNANPHVRFFDADRRGYVRCQVTPESFRDDFRLLAPTSVPGVTVPSPDTSIQETRSFVIPTGGTVQPA